MTSRRSLAAPAAALLLAASAGCSLGPGEGSGGEAELRVTRDYGSRTLVEAAVSDPAESDTVMRLLDRGAEVETRYGGGFVQSIDGLEGGLDAGRSLDWFFFVNGVESSIGAAEVPVRGGDRIWWDYRNWSEAMRAPAVVGSFPEPFVQAAEDERDPVRVECAGGAPACERVGDRLAEAGVEAGSEAFPGGGDAIRVLVGTWDELRTDQTAALIEDGPSRSGVFADFSRTGDAWRLEALDERGRPVRGVDSSGLVAALRPGEDNPVWVVTGTDAGGLEAAADALTPEELVDRYAVAATAEGSISLPVAPGGGA
jgi:Domain of unknown function (DUF4430)